MKRKNRALLGLASTSALLIFSFQNFTTTTSKVHGWVDGIIPNPKGGYLIRGWACQTGMNQSISVHVYFGHPAKDGVVYKTGIANIASSAAIGTECGTTLGKHIFSIPMSTRDYNRYAGRLLYVYGISAIQGGTNLQLHRSEVFAPNEPTYKEVNCATWDCVVDGNTRLAAGCVFNKQILFKRSDVTLDCNNATIEGPGPQNQYKVKDEAELGTRSQGIGILPGKRACDDTPLSAYGSIQYFEDPAVNGVVIKNCNINNFRFGVYLNRRVWVKSKSTGKCVRLSEFAASSPLKGSAADFDKYLGSREQHYPFRPHSVTLRNIKVTNSSEVGIFVNEYGRDWLVEDSSVLKNIVGVYFERENLGNKFYNSLVKDNKILGIAIDSSASNSIDRNIIDHNGYAGISLYRNCGEANGVPRYQHSNRNLIQRNFIKNHNYGFGLQTLTTDHYGNLPVKKYGVGIWVASRQGLDPDAILTAYPAVSRACVDDTISTPNGEYYADFSKENTIRWNNMSDNLLANVIVEDDRNVVEKNTFSTQSGVPSQADIIVGSSFRNLAIGPVKDNKIVGNKSTSQTLMGHYITNFGSTTGNNQFQENTEPQ